MWHHNTLPHVLDAVKVYYKYVKRITKIGFGQPARLNTLPWSSKRSFHVVFPSFKVVFSLSTCPQKPFCLLQSYLEPMLNIIKFLSKLKQQVKYCFRWNFKKKCFSSFNLFFWIKARCRVNTWHIMDFYKQRANEDIRIVQPDPNAYFNTVISKGTLDGVVKILFPQCSFTYPDGKDSLVKSFFVLDLLPKRFGCSQWHYKITAWNERAANLNMVLKWTYRFSKYKMKSSTSATTYPW